MVSASVPCRWSIVCVVVRTWLGDTMRLSVSWLYSLLRDFSWLSSFRSLVTLWDRDHCCPPFPPEMSLSRGWIPGKSILALHQPSVYPSERFSSLAGGLQWMSFISLIAGPAGSAGQQRSWSGVWATGKACRCGACKTALQLSVKESFGRKIVGLSMRRVLIS